VLYGFCVHYSECIGDLSSFLLFLLNSGLPLNVPTMTVLSDRGSAIVPTVTAVLPNAYFHYCPKHLERNIRVKTKDSKIISLYWSARCAVTQMECLAYLETMKVVSPQVCILFQTSLCHNKSYNKPYTHLSIL
jgi:hypothetical protein